MSEVDPVALARNRLRSPEDYARFQLFHAAHQSKLLQRFVDLKGKRILDAGCGTAGFATYLATLGNTVVGLDSEDFGAGMLRAALDFARSQRAQVGIVHGDLHHLPFADGSFDLLVMNSVLEHTADPLRVLREARRVLVPGGLAFVDFPLYYSPYGHHLAQFFPVPWQPVVFPSRVPAWLDERCPDAKTAAHHKGVFASLSKLTLRRYLSLVPQAGFERLYLRKNWFFTDEGQKMLSSIKRAVVERRPALVPQAIATAAREFAPPTFLKFLFFAAIFPFQWLPGLDELTCPGVSTILRRPLS